MLRQLVEQGNLGMSGEMSLSIIEPPSAINTLRLVVPELSVGFQETGDPDPRAAGRRGRRRALALRGSATRSRRSRRRRAQALALVRDLATPNWPGPTSLYDHAVALAGVPIPDLLGVLAYPPAPQDAPWPDGFAMEMPDYWVRSVQTIACVGLAHHRTDQPWEVLRAAPDPAGAAERAPRTGSARRPGWRWSRSAWAFPETRADVLEWLLNRVSLFMQVAEKRAVTVLGSMCHLVLACPWLEPKGRAFIADVLARLESEG